jgi:DNA-binding response OmpR family regulator
MARSLAEAEALLEHAAHGRALMPNDVVTLRHLLDDLPALAWSEHSAQSDRTGDAADSDPPEAYAARWAGRRADARHRLASHVEARELHREDVRARRVPIAALVVGDPQLAEALASAGHVAEHEATFECERTTDVALALELVRTLAPDVVVVDADVAGAPELVETLAADPIAEPTPIVMVGSFAFSEQASRLLALGVARALVEPVAADVLRSACEEVVLQRHERTQRIAIGEPTIEQLGERLADEVRRAIVEALDTTSRNQRVPLGEGTEVLGAVWGAIARVREVVTARTGGAVRFPPSGPEGAIALAPWLHPEAPGANRAMPRARGDAPEVRLDGRRVVVADDDPAVTWFIADLLRTAGCEVHEALDGSAALDLAHRVAPELVVSDILMPGLDGFALCRALRHDVALRDTPVILLSWKEDLLQRVRELGASAAAYLRKESDSRAIVARVREVLRGRARVEARLKSGGEVRGRLDGLSVRSLLQIVCATRRAACVSVRDASFLYEVEIRDGVPKRVTRTSADGAFARGERVLASLLGIGAGRFAVTDAEHAVRGELSGTLDAMLAPAIAHARGAMLATTGARMMAVAAVDLDETLLAAYVASTPEPMRTVVERLAHGASPRALVLAGQVAPAVLEEVLASLAARGAIVGVRDEAGADLLRPAADAALATMQGHGTVKLVAAPASAPPPPAPPAPAPPESAWARHESPEAHANADASGPFDAFAELGREIARDESSRLASPVPPVPKDRTSRPRVPVVTESALRPIAPPEHDGTNVGRVAPRLASPALDDLDAPRSVASSLADAVMRELIERSPEPSDVRTRRRAGSIVDLDELRPRSSNPPGTGAAKQAIPSVPPDAIVPGDAAPPATGAELLEATPVAPPVTEEGADGRDGPDIDPVVTVSMAPASFDPSELARELDRGATAPSEPAPFERLILPEAMPSEADFGPVDERTPPGTEPASAIDKPTPPLGAPSRAGRPPVFAIAVIVFAIAIAAALLTDAQFGWMRALIVPR